MSESTDTDQQSSPTPVAEQAASRDEAPLQTEATHRTDASTATEDQKKQRGTGLVFRVLLVVAITAVAIWGTIWWQERPLRQAEAALAENDLNYANYLLVQFLIHSPDNVRALALKGRTEVKLGNYQEAIQIFDKIGTATSADLHALSQAYLAEQRWSVAMPLLEQVLRFEPTNPDALHEMSVANMRMGQWDKALKASQKMAAIPGSEARGNVLVASIQIHFRNQTGAAAAFETALRHDPDAANLQIPAEEFFVQYGRLLLQMGKPKEALEPLKRSVAVRETADALVSLGSAATQMGEPDKARSAYLRALQIESLNAPAREALADIYLQKGDAQSAIGWLKPLENRAVASSSTSFLFQRIYQALGDKETSELWKQRTDAIRDREKRSMWIEMALVESPDSFWSKAILAHRFASGGNWNEADILVKNLLRQAPTEPFLVDLAAAIRQKSSSLPSLDRIPINQF